MVSLRNVIGSSLPSILIRHLQIRYDEHTPKKTDDQLPENRKSTAAATATVAYAARPEKKFEDCGKVLGVTVMVPGKGTVSGVVYTAGHFVRFFREGSDPLGWKNRDCHEKVVLESFLLALAYRLSQLEEAEPSVRPLPHHGEIVSVDAVDPETLMAADKPEHEQETDYLEERKPSEAYGRFQGIRSWSPKKDGWRVEAHKRRLPSGKEIWIKGHWARRQTWKKVIRVY